MKFHEVSKLCSSDQVCNQQMKSYPTYVHVISGTALVAMAGNEICGLIATYMGSKNLWPKSLENFDYLTLLCKTWIASCRIMPCRLISQVSKMARLIPADFFFRFRKVGFFRTLDEQRLEKSLAWGRRKLWSHIYRAAVYPASCWRWCSAGWLSWSTSSPVRMSIWPTSIPVQTDSLWRGCNFCVLVTTCYNG